ncbi:serine O-acetyltransferase [bacterium 210820-DFI.6.52]|uniref:Serine acetyltransferase n=1 Tax=Bittarella massiliensis (ex Durand et al. 2017) TaxID=1720313 RepID=A0AAQ1RVF6_9FIRM|nr:MULTISPECIES: serine O-acetyltransferase EpsC [Eubacteriales]MCB5941792.1 serine O-acetyltransferase [bacterium 210820-DFI.6.52]ERI99205.1 serine O-acetyltransferase [Clostridium sp. ATCC 29733]MZL68490.1 serine O-acetyltransferase [Bittarella massiliensis (ex Durand et al. 2017)]MZL79455.1 serine O-acetyltransferase [Bittarella massiliensis (ex Durand et al. 2017)]SHF84935.1 serine O-acetyltransferase [Bittarella massiliensis (ex Durand et al. 2017)]
MKWLEDARSILKKDPAARSLAEVVLLYPGYHALLWYRLAHRLYRRKHFFLARLLSQLGRSFTGIEIHPGAQIGRGLFIDHGAGVVIGETAVVGDNCTIYHGVTLGGTGKGEGKRHPTVGNDVLLGAGVKVLGPIEIGDGSRIGAGSVVLRPVPAGATAIGIPAAVVRQNGRRVDPPASETLNQRDYPDLLHNQLAHLARRLDRLEGECGRGRSAR